jgi:hypothetical protein
MGRKKLGSGQIWDGPARLRVPAGGRPCKSNGLGGARLPRGYAWTGRMRPWIVDPTDHKGPVDDDIETAARPRF